MNFIDVILVIPLAWFAYKGFSKGFIIEVTTLMALLLGIFLANRLSFVTADFLTNNLNFESEYLDIIAFTITFILVVIASMMLGKALTKLISVIQLSLVNKIAGALFSVLKVSFIISILIMIMANFQIEDMLIKKEQRESSLLYKPVKKIAPAVFPKLQSEDNLDFIDDVKGKINKEIDKVEI